MSPFAATAIPAAQWQAARALALPYKLTLILVILPQAVRIAIPPTVDFLVQIIKSTSLAAIIGFVELTRRPARYTPTPRESENFPC